MPHTRRRVDTGDEILAEPSVLVGFDDDLASEATRISNRIRGLLTGNHPALKRVARPRISHPAVLEILTRCGGPNAISVAGKYKLPAGPHRRQSPPVHNPPADFGNSAMLVSSKPIGGLKP